MKMSTVVFARFSSTGKPGLTKDVSGPVGQVIKAQIEWLGTAYMGSNIRITYARSQTELEQACGSAVKSDSLTAEDYMAEIMAMVESNTNTDEQEGED